MTQYEFLRLALLQIAGNPKFFIKECSDFYISQEWGPLIKKAAIVLLDVAIELGCFESEEPDITKQAFTSKALLQLIGNSAFGECGANEDWVGIIQSALKRALKIAEDNECITD